MLRPLPGGLGLRRVTEAPLKLGRLFVQRDSPLMGGELAVLCPHGPLPRPRHGGGGPPIVWSEADCHRATPGLLIAQLDASAPA